MIVERIFERIEGRKKNKLTLMSRVFGPHEDEVRGGRPVALYGAGVVGGELCKAVCEYGVTVSCFIDSSDAKIGQKYENQPVVSAGDFASSGSDALVVIAVSGDPEPILQALSARGVAAKDIVTLDYDLVLAAAIADPAVQTRRHFRVVGEKAFREKLIADRDQINGAYECLADEQSRRMLVERLAFQLNGEDIGHFAEFIRDFSEPRREFGDVAVKGVFPESRYYFRNDLIRLSEQEVLVDVGAYDGCSTAAFVEACGDLGIREYRSIAVEPDPENYRAMTRNTATYSNVERHNIGLWSSPGKFRFRGSSNCDLKSSSHIDDEGEIEIDVDSLDHLLAGRRVTLIKADPPGLIVVREALKGAENTIKTWLPKLIFAAYHSFEATYQIPLLLAELDRSYGVFLRHLSWSAGETHAFAIPRQS